LLVLVLSVGERQACAGVVVAVLSLFIVSPRAMYSKIWPTTERIPPNLRNIKNMSITKRIPAAIYREF